MRADVIVIGAGTVGSAIAYGLASRNLQVVVLDGGDRDFRAASANFGLVWQHGKGLNLPAYQLLTRQSVKLWPEFCADLTDVAGMDLQYEKQGGLELCLGGAQFENRRAHLTRLRDQLSGVEPDWEMLDRKALEDLLPKVKLGPEVVGASFGRDDGHANPLRLLSALQTGIVRKGGYFRGGRLVHTVTRGQDGAFIIDCDSERLAAPLLVIAAGLGSKALGAQVGLDIPIRPQRGQILVTERLTPFLPLPTSGIRQTREGTVMIGATHDEVGLDCSTTSKAAAALSDRAIRKIPALSDAKLVRQWAGLRILAPDEYPIYAQSETHPGAFIAACHSGVTLAAAHATALAGAIAAGRLPSFFDAFHHRRFDVPKVA